MNYEIRQNADALIIELLDIQDRILELNSLNCNKKEIVNKLEGFDSKVKKIANEFALYSSKEGEKYNSVAEYFRKSGKADVYLIASRKFQAASSLLASDFCIKDMIDELKIGNNPFFKVSFLNVIKKLYEGKWVQ